MLGLQKPANIPIKEETSLWANYINFPKVFFGKKTEVPFKDKFKQHAFSYLNISIYTLAGGWYAGKC